MTEKGYHRNHYVPNWYQRAFMHADQTKYHYLDLKPEMIERDGHRWARRDLRTLGTNNCFAQDDLYTTRWGQIENVDIEKFFFGGLDTAGKEAVEAYAEYSINDKTHANFHTFIRYMSVQKLRTPKGLDWLSAFTRSRNMNVTLHTLQRFQNLFCATWTDCIWQIADASQSPIKFIVSDHPVTVYNRECFPGSDVCRYPGDPDIRLTGTHTIFPLSLNKVLILTNLAWVRDPYQSATRLHPNPRLMRDAVFNMMGVQTGRQLTEEEVLEINFIIKRRAKRYIAAAEKAWLYPEKMLRCDHWRKLGNGYLLMPDPRHVYMGGEIVVGFDNGQSDAWGPYGHKPWEAAYTDKERESRETKTLYRFKAEWSAMVGRRYRGRTHEFSKHKSDEEWPESYERALAHDAEYRKKPGERQRRRRLTK